MQPLNFKPQQLRLLASVVAACLCLTLCTTSCSRLLVHAVELPVVLDHDSLIHAVPHALTDGELVHTGVGETDTGASEDYAPDFAYLDRSLIGRQAPDVDKLTNNEQVQKEIAAEATLYFVLEQSQLRLRRADDASLDSLQARGTVNVSGQEAEEQREFGDIEDADHRLEKRQDTTRIWISANTCRQPMPDEVGMRKPNSHPQLVMYVSTSRDNQKPGPDSTKNLATNITGVLFDSGYGVFELNTTSDIYIGISAPKLDAGWTGSWQFELAASTDGPYHSYNDTNPFLFMIDTDSDSALFITSPLATSNDTDVVDQWREQNPFNMYAFQAGDYTSITGMEHSYCALKEQFNLNSTKNFTVTSSITTKFDDLPKSQFHVQGLDAGKSYNGFVVVEANNATSALPGVGTVRAGGKVFQQFNWITKAGTLCPEHMYSWWKSY